MLRRKLETVLVSICLVAICASCSNSNAAVSPVSGKVTFKGNAVADAMVRFVSAESSTTAYGKTNEKGEFQLTTFDTNDGAVVGEHMIAITQLEAPQVPAADMESSKKSQEDYLKMMSASGTKGGGPPRPTLKNLLPPKYADPAKSGLRRTVVAGKANTFSFDLTE